MTLLILIFGGFAIYLLLRGGTPGGTKPPVVMGTIIPVRVIDPLGGEDEDDLDDLMDVCKILSATGDAVEVHRKITGEPSEEVVS